MNHPGPHSAHDRHPPHSGRGSPWTDYLPLLIIAALAILTATAKQAALSGGWDGRAWMHDLMGILMVILSMFKFFDLPGFADGFQMYDLLAKPFRPYAYAYPFVELGIGLGYLARWNLPLVYAATMLVMSFGALGVLRALRQGLDLRCACMGTVLKVPLSTVALSEDLGMAVMAAAMWAAH